MVNLNLVKNDVVQPRIYTPGEGISSLQDFWRRHGTYVDDESTLRASVTGVLEKVNKLFLIRPFKVRYQGEIGDIIGGRITEVQQERWKVDTNSKLDSVLLLSSVNFLGGELRRRSAEDEQLMRKYLQERDLICAEVQSTSVDGYLSLHTRVLKYGKLSQGIILKVSPALIKKKKSHFDNLENVESLILGNNGNIWIGASRQDTDRSEGGFTQDLSRIPQANREVCARLRNCILIQAHCNMQLADTSVTYAYEESIEYKVEELLEAETMVDISLLTRRWLIQVIFCTDLY